MRILICVLTLMVSTSFFAQELNCQVSVTSDPALDITTREKEVLDNLKQAIFEFMNNTVWTQDQYEVEERINCILQLSITKVNGSGSYEGQLQIKATRPVFNTSYNTAVFNYMDKNVAFSYQENTKMVFSKNQFSSNLSSILAFYAYYILGLDGDTFAKDGGSIYFEEAQNIVTLAQSSGGAGWKASDRKKRNRFWLIDNTLQSLFEPLRACSYIYHREGLDLLYKNKKEGKAAIIKALKLLLKITQTRPGSTNIANFMQAKRDELIGIFQDAPQEEKTEAVNLFKRIDPANSTKYQAILQ